jgi:adenylate cyclase class IV
MSDTFLPCQDDGEIMRIRQEHETAGARRTVFTIKQWVKTRTGRTRKEAESDAPSTVALIFLVAGRMLSGKALVGFSKNRQLFEGQLNSDHLIISIDEVFGLGEFSGWYMEAEVLVPLDKDPADYEEPILKQVQELLGDTRLPVKQSYREMLLESYRLAGVAPA